MNEPTKYQKFARANYTPFGERDEMWHDQVIAECDIIDAEERERKAKEQERIKKVVSETADISAALTGNIIVKVGFEGSHPKKKALTKTETTLVMSLPSDVKAKIKGDKPLFECAEYDDLISFEADRRNEFARFGIPHVAFDGACVTSVMNIPDIEALAEKTSKELAEKVETFLSAWPKAIDEAQERLGPLFNPADYVPATELRKAFRFSHNWLAFGVPDELKQFDAAIYQKAQEKAKAVWDEIEANGVALLRQTIAELVGGLAESLTPKENGEKRKFYPSAVEKIVEFIDSFKKRNICKDAELEEQVEKLRSMVSGIDVEKLSAGAKGDEALREKVRAKMEQAKKGLDALTVSASARVIKLRD